MSAKNGHASRGGFGTEKRAVGGVNKSYVEMPGPG
jgi:hypothetical protein